MRALLQVIVNAYSVLLNLYPPGFRDEFAAEMFIVFQDSVVYAAKEGVLPVITVCVRELLNLPFNVLREVWHETRRKQAEMQSAQKAPMRQEAGSWGDALWAGLPHLLLALIALGAALTEFVTGANLESLLDKVVVFLLLAGFLATIYYTWRRHWPAWSASWNGYAGLIILLFSILPSQDWAPPVEGIFVVIRVLLLPLCSAALLYWLSRRNPIEALLMAMPVIIVYWLPVMEFVPNLIRAWLTLGIFIISAITDITITRFNSIHSAIWIMLGASILVGLPISYTRSFWQVTPWGNPDPGTFNDMVEMFFVPWLASIALVMGPILGRGIWNFSKRYGRDGRIAASLIIIGALVNLWGQFRYWQWFSHQTFFNALGFPFLQVSGYAWPSYTAYAGLIAALVGGILLAIQAWTDNKPLSIFLILLPLVLPSFAMFPIHFGFHIIPAGLSFEFGDLRQTYKFLIFFAGALLVVASGGTVTRLYSEPSPIEGAV